MPLYEYSCDTCSQKIELLIRGDEKPECPHCHGQKLTKLLSVVRGHVSGGGGPAPAEMCGRPQCGMGGCQGLG
jgi:putative FmdB family regulatory protein